MHQAGVLTQQQTALDSNFMQAIISPITLRANNPKILIPVVLAIGAFAVALTLFTGGKPYSANPDDVRAQFNSDKGKVRLLMLLSPS